ncbi:hypothetical protein EBF04_08095 [Streptomyces sp. I6]|nr:hypothetical protein EBF04_08095 [Streptomyces sp. I6]
MDLEEVNRYVAEMTSAAGIRHDFGDGHDLPGRRMRDVRPKRGRRYEPTHAGRGLLLTRPAGSRSGAGKSGSATPSTPARNWTYPQYSCARRAAWRGWANTGRPCSPTCLRGSAPPPAEPASRAR